MDAQSPTDGGAKPTGRYGELRFYKRNRSREIDREALDRPDDYGAAFNRLFDRNPSATDTVVVYQPNWSGLNELLKTEWQRDLVVSDLQSYLAEELKASVSSSDYENFRQHGVEIPDQNSRRTVCKAIDEIILQAAVEQGPNIFLVPMVRQRLTDWVVKEKDGSKHWEELGKRFALLARVLQRKAKAPLYPWWIRSRRDIIQELKALRKYLRPLVAHRDLSREKLVDVAMDATEENESKFPKLLRIGVPFLTFIGQPESGVFRRLLDGTLSPANFTDQLIQWVTNYTPTSARQTISNLLGSKPTTHS